MRLGSFTSGAKIALDGRTYRLAVKNTRGWQGVDCENSLLSEWGAEELEAAYTAGRLTFVAEGQLAKERAPPVLVLPDLNARQQAEAIFRAKFLVEVARKRSICASVGGPRVGTRERLAPILAEVSAELGRKEGVSVAAFYRWVALSSQGVAGLVDRRGSKTGRRCSGAPLAKQVMADVIQGAKQTSQVGAPASITMAALEKAVRSRIKTENLNRSTLWFDDPGIAVPSKSTLSRIWKEFPADDRAIVEHGATKARAMFRGGPGVERPEACLDLVEYDETPLPLYFFDEEIGVPLGHAWLSWYIDAYSGVPIGFYLGFEPPSDLTICSALRHACLPKTYVKDAYPAIQNRYVGGGVPRTVTFDNGLSQWGRSIETIGLELNMTIQFATVRTPWFKPLVEGAFNVLNQRLLREMPGFVLGKNIDRKDYDPSRHGCIGIRHFLYIFHAWLVDVYLQTPRGIFKTTPAERWTEGTAKCAPELISSATDLDILFGVVREGRLDHRGVVYESLRYHSPALHALRRQLGDRLDVEVKINPSDLGAVHVRHEQSRCWIRAEATEQRYARGLSLHRHKLHLRHARERFGDARMESLRQAEDFLHELIAEALPRAPQAVLLEIVRFAGGRQACTLSQEDIANRLRVSRKTVTRAMVCLRELGLIDTDRTTQQTGRRRGYRGADQITLCENAWSIVPSATLVQRDTMSLKNDPTKGSECPFGLRDKMSQQLEYTSKGGDRDHESGRRAEDVGRVEGHTRTAANDLVKLRLLPGGRAA